MNDRGYPAVAKFIAQDPDHETFVFHRFDLLTARNLLNLQSELVALQQDLVALDKEANSGSDPDLALSLRSWRIMEDKAQSNDKVRESLNLAIKLEHKLKKYHKALLLSESVAKLESPSDRVLGAYRDSLQKNLGDVEKSSLSEAVDHAALRPPADKDILSRILRDYWPFPSFPSTGGSDGVSYFNEHHLTRLLTVISIFIAAGLIVGPMVALNFTKNANARLGIAIAFIVLFASALSISTAVSRDNVFIATATYSAVLVVFVSGNLVNSPGGTNGP